MVRPVRVPRPRQLSEAFLDRFVRTAPVDPGELEAAVWSADPQAWAAYPSSYTAALLEQYTACVEMAERVSARRSLTNMFFLTLNSGILTAFGVGWQSRSGGHAWWLVFPLVALTGQCLAWFWILRSYRQLNAAKYAVIGALEERLPAAPHVRAEWTALGRGSSPVRYFPLTKLEQWVPVLFAVTYLVAFVAAVVSGHG